MTDLEICKRIAEIEKPLNLEYDPKGYPMIKVQSVAEYIDYNPLTDKALCFDLMIKHKVELTILTGDWWDAEIKAGKFDNYNKSVSCRSPQRAICSVIIAKYEDKDNE